MRSTLLLAAILVPSVCFATGCAHMSPSKADNRPKPVVQPPPPDLAAPDDLIRKIDLTKHITTGQWIVENDRVIVTSYNGAKLHLPVVLDSSEYDVSVEFTRYQGNQGFGLYLTSAGKSFLLQVSAVDNQWVVMNDVEKSEEEAARLRRPLEPNGTRRRLDVAVRKSGVKMFIDQQEVFDYKTDFSNVLAKDWGFGNASLGLISWFNVIAFHKVVVTPIK